MSSLVKRGFWRVFYRFQNKKGRMPFSKYQIYNEESLQTRLFLGSMARKVLEVISITPYNFVGVGRSSIPAK